MSLEELQKENGQLKKEVEKLKEKIDDYRGNIYTIRIYAKQIEYNLQNAQKSLEIIFGYTRFDDNE